MAPTDKTVTVEFIHPSYDARGISAADFKKAGLDGASQQTFYKGRPASVTPDMAKVLLESPLFAGEFVAVKDVPADTPA